MNESLSSSLQFDTNRLNAVLVKKRNLLFIIYNEDGSSAKSFIQVFDDLSWSDPVPLQLNILQNIDHLHLSVAAVQDLTIYVNNGHTVYSVQIPTDSENTPTSKLSTTHDTVAATNHQVSLITPVSRSVTLEVATPLSLMDTSRKRKSEDSNLDLGSAVKVPKCDTCVTNLKEAIKNVVTTKIASPPLGMSTICTVECCLFAFGGRDEDNQPSSSIYPVSYTHLTLPTIYSV